MKVWRRRGRWWWRRWWRRLWLWLWRRRRRQGGGGGAAAAVVGVHEGRPSPPRSGAVDLLDLECHVGRREQVRCLVRVELVRALEATQRDLQWRLGLGSGPGSGLGLGLQ